MTTVPAAAVVPPVEAGETARAYLVRLGLAKPTRGRLSGAAHAALTAAREAGAVFVEVEAPAPATPRAPRPTVAKAPAAPRVSVDKAQTKIIRTWAQAQDGLTVGARGVLPPDVIAAYKAAHGDLPAGGSTTTVVRRPTPLDMPRRTNLVGLATANGITHVQDRCGKCSRSVQNCHTDTCPQGPMATGGVTGPLVLV